MGKIKIVKTPKPTVLNEFKGLNLDSTGDTSLELGESGNMTNWRITENKKLKKIEGYAQLFSNLSGTIRGMWNGRINGTEQMLFAINSLLYARTELSGVAYNSLDTSTYSNVDIVVTTVLNSTQAGTTAVDNIVVVDNLVEVADIDIDYNSSVGKFFYNSSKEINLIVAKGTYINITEVRAGIGTKYVYTPIGTVADVTVNMFAFNDTLYIQDGTSYQYWNGTGSIGDVVGYVPIIFSATPPDGGGTALEGVNLLNSQKRQQFNSDGTTATYQLAETDVDSIDKVYLEGVLQTVTTDYTVNLTNGTITWVSTPDSGENDVEIYWTKDNDIRKEIEQCRTNMLFGGKNDTRVFMWGDVDNENIIHYSDLDGNGLASAEYFPANFFNEVGSNEYKVTDVVRQYDRQIIYTNKETFYSYYDSYTNTDELTTVTFPVYTLNEVKGNVAFDQVRIINNNPYSIFDGVQEWIATDVRDERNAQYISKRVQPDLNDVDLSTAITIDWEQKWEYWLCVGTQVWVHNYRLDMWYRYELSHTPTSFRVIDGEMYFGTASTIMKFNSLLTSFNGEVITATWEMNFYDFMAGWLRKQISKIWLSLKPEPKGTVTINWESDHSQSTTTTQKVKDFDIFTFEDVDFADFTFNTNYSPKPFRVRLKAKKFTYFKVILTNISATQRATVLSIVIPQNYGGESK